MGPLCCRLWPTANKCWTGPHQGRRHLRGERDPDLGLDRRQRHRTVLLLIGHGYGNRDAVCCGGRVGGGDRHLVGTPGLIVQERIGLQLPRRVNNSEGCRVGPAERVGQGVGVGGGNRGADVGAG